MRLCSPQPEGEIIDCEASHYDYETDNLLAFVRYSQGRPLSFRVQYVL